MPFISAQLLGYGGIQVQEEGACVVSFVSVYQVVCVHLDKAKIHIWSSKLGKEWL